MIKITQIYGTKFDGENSILNFSIDADDYINKELTVVVENMGYTLNPIVTYDAILSCVYSNGEFKEMYIKLTTNNGRDRVYVFGKDGRSTSKKGIVIDVKGRMFDECCKIISEKVDLSEKCKDNTVNDVVKILNNRLKESRINSSSHIWFVCNDVRKIVLEELRTMLPLHNIDCRFPDVNDIYDLGLLDEPLSEKDRVIEISTSKDGYDIGFKIMVGINLQRIQIEECSDNYFAFENISLSKSKFSNNFMITEIETSLLNKERSKKEFTKLKELEYKKEKLIESEKLIKKYVKNILTKDNVYFFIEQLIKLDNIKDSTDISDEELKKIKELSWNIYCMAKELEVKRSVK